MSNIENNFISLLTEDLEKAYLFIANELLITEKSKISDCIIRRLEKNSAHQLIGIIISFISINKNAFISNSSSYTLNHLPSKIKEACPIITNTKNDYNLEAFLEHNTTFKYLTSNHIEEIGNTYDILQSYELHISNGIFVIKTSDTAKKKAGSFYTPISIVDFIVQKTLGRFIDDKILEFNQKYNNSHKSKSDLIKDILKVRIL
ncbi:MAG: hypothetical protein K8S87_09270, partial [Planctomycetes bacterium]|nr:hypothetical protein [Planctomycetota bacterium]